MKIRLANHQDIPHLKQLIEESVRHLQRDDYTPAEIEAALTSIYGVDTRLISDGTYYVVEAEIGDFIKSGDTAFEQSKLIACGGWSKRATLFGGDQFRNREDNLLDPARDAAKIRAFFVLPGWERRGLASRILNACEAAARVSGFRKLELGATLTGVPFYLSKGYLTQETVDVSVGENQVLPVVKMSKEI